MRTIIAVVVGLFACDQGVVAKPKPAIAAAVEPQPALAADGPFTAAAWDFVAPVLTAHRNK